MIFKKLLKGLPVLGVLSMLLACPTGDAEIKGADGEKVDLSGVNTKVTDLKTQLEKLEKGMLTKEDVQKLANAGVIIDPKKPVKAWGKISNIMLSSKQNPCSVFYPNGAGDTLLTPYTIAGPKGGSFSFRVADTLAKEKTGTADPGAKLSETVAATEVLVFEYKDYSIDGLYKLNGKFIFKGKKIEKVGDVPYAKSAAANNGYTLVGGSEETTLNFEPVSDAVKTLAGFDATVAKVEVVFGKKFGLAFKATDGKTCPVVGKNEAEDAEVTMTIGAVETKITKDNPNFEAVFGKQGDTAITA